MTTWEKLYKQYLKSEIKHLSALQTDDKRNGYHSSYNSYRISKITAYLKELNRLNGTALISHSYKDKNRTGYNFEESISLGNGYCVKSNKGFKKETYALHMNDYGFNISKTRAITETSIYYEDGSSQSWYYIIDMNDDISILKKRKEELEAGKLSELKSEYKFRKELYLKSQDELSDLYKMKEDAYQIFLKQFEEEWNEKIKPLKKETENLRKESSKAWRAEYDESYRIFKTLKGE